MLWDCCLSDVWFEHVFWCEHSLTSPTSVSDLLLVTVSVNNEVVAYHCVVTASPFHI
jgi:hypothetical protein